LVEEGVGGKLSLITYYHTGGGGGGVGGDENNLQRYKYLNLYLLLFQTSL